MKRFETLTQDAENKIIFAKFRGMRAIQERTKWAIKYKPGFSHFVEIIIAILVAIVVGATFMTLSNEGMRTLFTDFIGRITSGFTG